MKISMNPKRAIMPKRWCKKRSLARNSRAKWSLGISTKYLNKLQSSEMKFARSVKGCSVLDKIKNEGIRKELETESMATKIREC